MTALLEVLQVVAALVGIALFFAILWIGLTYCFKIYYQNRKEYLERGIKECTSHIDLKLIVEYSIICNNMGYKREETASKLRVMLTENETKAL